jgi:hypothetical protein
MECGRLKRTCGRAPLMLLFLRTHSGDNDLLPSSPLQPHPGGDGGPPPRLAPKWSYWELVLRIKRVLHKDGKDIRDYVEAGRIDELYELSNSDENTCPCFLKSFFFMSLVHLD